MLSVYLKQINTQNKPFNTPAWCDLTSHCNVTSFHCCHCQIKIMNVPGLHFGIVWDSDQCETDMRWAQPQSKKTSNDLIDCYHHNQQNKKNKKRNNWKKTAGWPSFAFDMADKRHALTASFLQLNVQNCTDGPNCNKHSLVKSESLKQWQSRWSVSVLWITNFFQMANEWINNQCPLSNQQTLAQSESARAFKIPTPTISGKR